MRKYLLRDFHQVFEKGVVMRQGLRQLSRLPGERARLPGRRLMLGASVVAASAVAAIFASAASASPPVHFNFGPDANTSTITGVCPFDITVDSISSGTGEDFFDRSGNLIREHDNINEQDTFSANGKSLTGLPYTFNLEFLVDSSGNTTGLTATGVAEKVPLPDGRLFVSAGYVDFAAHGFPDFILTPDHGGAVNLAGFCAALAP